MNAEKTGTFILKLRGELGLTQKELADKIGVTDKAVSKWERGRGFPDVGVLEILARELGVSVTELMNGERSTPENAAAQSDSAILETMRYVKSMARKTIGVLSLITGACLIYAPLVTTGSVSAFPFLISGILIIIGGIFMLTVKKTNGTLKISAFVFELISLGALAAALVLETLPSGVVMRWAAPPGEPQKISFCAYFDLLSYGYGLFPPFITAILTAAAVVLSIIALIIGRKHTKLRGALFVLLVVTAAVSASIILYGFQQITAVGALITLMLALSAVFRAAANARNK